MPKLKASEVGAHRELLLTHQQGVCALCRRAPTPADPAVLDHDHGTGRVRGTLHRSCNSLLGKVENGYKRYRTPNLNNFLRHLEEYLVRGKMHVDDPVIYPTHKTPDEKREARNKAARKKRAAAKGAV